MNMGKEKKLAVITSMILIFITVASLFYIVEEQEHDCTGADCPVCACIHQAEQTLRTLGTGYMVMPFIYRMIVSCNVSAADHTLYIHTTSLVSQKVRLND